MILYKITRIERKRIPVSISKLPGRKHSGDESASGWGPVFIGMHSIDIKWVLRILGMQPILEKHA
jgi:hypothetical protein